MDVPERTEMNTNEALAISQMSRAQGTLIGIIDALTVSMNYDTRDAVYEKVKDAEVLWHDGAGLLLAELGASDEQ